MAGLRLMAEVSTVVGSSLDGEVVLRRLARLVVPELADWCVVDLIGDELRRVALVHRDPDVRPAPYTAGMVLPAPGPVPGRAVERVLAGEGPLVSTEFPAADSPLGREHRQLIDAFGAHTEVLVPLRVRRRVLGVLGLVRTSPERPVTAEDLELIQDIAHRAAIALDNARLYASVRGAAHDLQRALLPELPDLGRLETAARYLPAQDEAEVGGDWYDAFVLPDGAAALAVGDVCGHDRAAAVEMSKLQNMLRALAWDHQDPPSGILRRLDALMDYLRARTATAVFGRVDGPDGGPWTWSWSNAGHPPPLLLAPDGRTRYLGGAPDPLLGTGVPLPRTDRTEALRPGRTLLLYSDGLVERRGESLSRGMVRLRQQLALRAREPVGALCDSLLECMVPEPEDDVVLLALRVPGGG
ncbi:PP2C family protein-serine/threonine phosphatase [Streptomonospora nanhaiensis]|uniref:PP2C family protein-serine/threonine phosphatase n=1 Tax=Streptomonospora nanhaiensis TaxID=1323731 RepID=UPI001C385D42|nr:GAF domain-containing SpoIIE family protein phosphatase [Streptomonospora nanhaiensis]MBV2365727.1 SpoIIE family protein phosphatase [Streptomonospora nanhaiensis]MBX9387549.1 SpoIIE family protein phosphatase [Streptomonospora nanhaiensis]